MLSSIKMKTKTRNSVNFEIKWYKWDREKRKKEKKKQKNWRYDIDAMAHRVFTTHHNGNEALLFWMFSFFSRFSCGEKKKKTQENSSATSKYSIALTIYFFSHSRKKRLILTSTRISYVYVSVCMNTDHYLDLHMSRIMLLTFWHIFLVLFNFWRAFYARYSHKMTCIFRSVSVIVRVNGVPSKWLYFVSCWCCQCRCLFASFSTCNMRARHKWHPWMICVSRRMGFALDQLFRGLVVIWTIERMIEIFDILLFLLIFSGG